MNRRTEEGIPAGEASQREERPRFPAFVYRDGDEPDPRFSLANERTYLAWIPTSLALAAAAIGLDVALAASAPNGGSSEPSAAVLTLTASAMLSAVVSWLRWARAERAMRVGAPLPSPLAAGVLVALVLVAIVLALVELWTL